MPNTAYETIHFQTESQPDVSSTFSWTSFRHNGGIQLLWHLPSCLHVLIAERSKNNSSKCPQLINNQ
jgi:hypothetical protein